MMKTISECILRKIQIDNSALDDIVLKFVPRKIKKGDYFLQSGNICREMAFIQSGYLRMYNVDKSGREITTWIGGNGKFITSIASFALESPNLWSIEAVTDGNLLVINQKDHFELCERYRKWLEFENFLLASAFAAIEHRMFVQLHNNARQRYEQFFENNSNLFNQIPLQYIASMLGITPETLSRIRSKP